MNINSSRHSIRRIEKATTTIEAAIIAQVMHFSSKEKMREQFSFHFFSVLIVSFDDVRCYCYDSHLVLLCSFGVALLLNPPIGVKLFAQHEWLNSSLECIRYGAVGNILLSPVYDFSVWVEKNVDFCFEFFFYLKIEWFSILNRKMYCIFYSFFSNRFRTLMLLIQLCFSKKKNSAKFNAVAHFSFERYESGILSAILLKRMNVTKIQCEKKQVQSWFFN